MRSTTLFLAVSYLDRFFSVAQVGAAAQSLGLMAMHEAREGQARPCHAPSNSSAYCMHGCTQQPTAHALSCLHRT